MTTAVPAFLTWPLLTLMAVVVGIRYRYFNTNQYERFFNHTLALMLLANLLRERAIHDALAAAGVLTVTQSQQLSLAVLIFAAGEIIGLTMVWLRVPTEAIRIRQRRVRVSGFVLAAGFLAAGKPARDAGMPLEVYGGWTSVTAWVFNTAMFLAMAAQLIRLSAREWRRAGSHGREKAAAAGIFVIGMSVAVTSLEAIVLSTIQQLGWVYTANWSMAIHGSCVFWESVGAMLLGAVPIVVAAQSHFGFDATTRQWRQLEPLRISMVTAVPACAFELAMTKSGRGKSLLELHQSTIQIRDAMLALRPYMAPIAPEAEHRFITTYDVPEDEREIAMRALALAYAVTAKVSGAQPRADEVDEGGQWSQVVTLEQDSVDLVRMAKWWQRAQQAAHPAYR